MPAPQFISTDGAAIIAELVAIYEAESGRTLQPAQPERLLINSFAEAALRTRLALQIACEQMLVNYSSAPALDELAALVNVQRLPASSASTTILFTCIASPSGNLIPAGTRVGSSDGRVSFAVAENTEVAPSATTVSAIANAQTAGTVGNGYAVGEILVPLDPLPFVISSVNTTQSAGGADSETDAQLRERVKLAPATFSVAGPREAYKFFAFTASPTIIDVAVGQIVPGTVGVYPLVAGGTTPPETIALVSSILSADDVRPLTDTVVVESPTVVAYDLEVEVEILEGQNSTDIEAAVTAALQAYADEKASKCGRDIVISQIITRASVAGVYSVTVVEPISDEVVEFNEVAILGTLTVTITGDNPG